MHRSYSHDGSAVRTPDIKAVSFNVPKEYLEKQLEVIAFTEDEGIAKEKLAKKKVTFAALSIDTKGINLIEKRLIK